VGRGGVEPPTSRLSGVRSNHLSYRPNLDGPVDPGQSTRAPQPRRRCRRSGCWNLSRPEGRVDEPRRAAPNVASPVLVEPIGIEPMTY
jgi:hypothetical protein